MEEWAQHNPGKINKTEFLTAIQGPFEKAFTLENIKKGFEKTGTWPINQNQITAEMMGPSEGVSGMSTPIISLNSPVNNTIQLLDIALAACSQSQVTGSPSPPTSPASQNSSLMDNPAPPLHLCQSTHLWLGLREPEQHSSLMDHPHHLQMHCQWLIFTYLTPLYYPIHHLNLWKRPS